MRDISRMFEGLLLCHKIIITNKVEFLRLWIHEAHRVYSDRFITNNDQELFIKILNEKLAFYFDQVYHNVCQNREAKKSNRGIVSSKYSTDDSLSLNKWPDANVHTFRDHNQPC